MGFVSVMGTCVVCRKVIMFNPNKVPSVRVEGKREPICRECIEEANPKRIANGLEPIVIHPDAYESAREEDVNWDG